MGRLKGQSGESLIMVLMAVGIAGVLVLGILSYVNSLQRQVKSVEARTEALELLAEVKSILALTNACRLNFQGQTLPEIGEPLKVPRLQFANPAGDALTSRDIVAVDQKLPHGSIIRSIGLVPTVEVIAGSAFVGKLEILLETKGAFVPAIKRSASIAISTDATNRVVDCRVDASMNGSSSSLRSCRGAPEEYCWFGSGIVCSDSNHDSPSGTVLTASCASGFQGTGSRYLCLDGNWAEVSGPSCTPEVVSGE
ncbi:MAG: hypothetical protein AB7F86_05290 [Bdellovibrionales bacterium]